MVPESLLYSIATFAFATSVTPGPNNMMLLASGVNFGFKRSMPHAAGISVGFLVLLFAVCFGLSVLFQRFPIIYQVMKVLGFSYLLYLAWGVATSDSLPTHKQPQGSSRPLSFWGALVFQAVNPKAWMISVSFASNYLPQDATPTGVILYCLLVAAINFPSIGVWLWMGTKLERALRDPTRRKIFNWLMAALLLASMLPVLWI